MAISSLLFFPSSQSDFSPCILCFRMDKVIDDSTAVKKVPIKIVHSESSTEKENRQYLHPSTETPLSLRPTVLSLSSLGAPEQSSSPFCTYTRQREQENETTGVQEQELHADVSGLQEVQKGSSVDQSANGVSPGSLSAAACQSEEDEKREVLARDIIDKDKSLADILDQSKRRTTMDLMEGIFPEGEQLVEEAHQRRRAAPKLTSSRSSEERSGHGFTLFLVLFLRYSVCGGGWGGLFMKHRLEVLEM